MNNVILTDVDGVLLDWEYAFDVWMQQHGFQLKNPLKYNIGTRYNIDNDQGKTLIKIFNESAHMGFLPPLRDAMEYVKKLHQDGFVFHVITSLTKDQNACKLRKMNLQKLFGKNVFEKFVFLDTGADKDEALAEYQNSNLFWIEDKILNCVAGQRAGLRSILMEHGHSMDFENPEIPKVKNWKEIYNIITASSRSTRRK
jgi:FMN phosphatase YigB (HAD superfamily)